MTDGIVKEYNEAWESYEESISNLFYPRWDYVVITASNAEQGKWFQSQLDLRREKGFLPRGTEFGIVPDPVGERVGNGGATLGALRFVAEKEGRSDFSGLRILVILSSGDAKRVAQYSAIGKVFSPVPRVLPNGEASTLFDEIMMSVAAVPGKIEEGVLILSGDVLLVFDGNAFCVRKGEAAALAFKAPAIMGTGHGFFKADDNGYIRDVWHKLPIPVMEKLGAIDEDGCVNIDTGAVFFPPEIASKLYSLITDEDGRCTPLSFASFVNGVIQPSLYVDFFYPLSKTATFDGYMKEVPEGRMCPELLEARKHLWEILSPYSISLLEMSPAKFIDFGTTKDVMDLMTDGIKEYEALGWKRQVASVNSGNSAGMFHSITKSPCSDSSYLEYSIITGSSSLGERSILSFVEVKDHHIPSGIVISGLRMRNGHYVARIYGVEDNPKKCLGDGCVLFGLSIDEFISKYGLNPSELWNDGEEQILWNARIYEEADTMEKAVDSALKLYDLFHGNGDSDRFINAKRTSLSLSFNEEDGTFASEWLERIHDGF